MKVPITLDIGPRSKNDLSDFIRMFRTKWERVTGVINGHIGFGDGVKADNVDLVWLQVTTPVTPDTDFVLTHNLLRVPVGYLIVRSTGQCSVYNGSMAATEHEITLRATVAGVDLSLWVF